jgi:phage portal protein BeeE
MNHALTKALADSERSYCAAKASVASATSSLLAQGPGGVPLQRSDLSKSHEQLKHFTGWVYAAVRPICQKIAGQKIHVGRVKSPGRLATKQTGDVEPLDSHPLLDLLADPNDLMVAWSLMYTTVASLELTGRSLWWLPGKKKIFPIPTTWIQGFQGTTRFDSFVIRSPWSSETFNIPTDETVYFHYPNPHDPHGATSPLGAVGGAVDADESMTNSQIAMFNRGIHPSHAIIVGKEPCDGIPGGLRPRLTGVQQRQVISAILKRYAGTSKHGEPLILDGLIEDVKKLSNSPEEMDWLNSGKVTKARIFEGFGVNPIVAGAIEGSNRASAAAADKHFCDFCVNPIIELMSQTLTEFLSPMFGGGLKIWIEPAISDNSDLSYSWATLLASNGCLTAHELRALSPFGLPKENYFDNTLVGGQNMATTNPIESGIRAIMKNELGSIGADRILEMIEGNGNGSSRF